MRCREPSGRTPISAGTSTGCTVDLCRPERCAALLHHERQGTRPRMAQRRRHSAHDTEHGILRVHHHSRKQSTECPLPIPPANPICVRGATDSWGGNNWLATAAKVEKHPTPPQGMIPAGWLPTRFAQLWLSFVTTLSIQLRRSLRQQLQRRSICELPGRSNTSSVARLQCAALQAPSVSTASPESAGSEHSAGGIS